MVSASRESRSRRGPPLDSEILPIRAGPGGWPGAHRSGL